MIVKNDPETLAVKTLAWKNDPGVLAGGIVTGFGLASLGLITAQVLELEDLPASGYDNAKAYRYQIKNFGLNITSTFLSLMRYYFPEAFGNRVEPPAAVVGGIPLGTVDELSHSVSDLLTHYRATSGVFLAHQPGGHQSLRIMGKSWGQNRYVFLTMLDWLFRYGKSTMMDHYRHVIGEGADIAKSEAINKLTTDPFEEIRPLAMNEGKEEYRLTIPVITRNKVYMNMHIETYTWSESVEEGMNVINFTLFFRKFTPEPPKQYKKVVDKKTKDVTYFYRSDYKNTIYKKLQMLDIGLEIGYTASILLYRAFQYTKPEERLVTNVCANVSREVNGDAKFDDYLQGVFLDEDKNVSGDLTLNDKEMLMQIA